MQYTTSSDVDPTKFLNDLRARIANSAEFKALAAELYGGVRDSLRADGLPSFSSMAVSEQEVLVGRARTALIGTETYAACRDSTWRALDAALDGEAEALLSRRTGGTGGPRGPGLAAPGTAAEAAQTLGTDASEQGKVHTILELASGGATQLLERWPEQQDELLWLLNTEMPPQLVSAARPRAADLSQARPRPPPAEPRGRLIETARRPPRSAAPSGGSSCARRRCARSTRRSATSRCWRRCRSATAPCCRCASRPWRA